MNLLPRDLTYFEDAQSEGVYPSTSYPYQHIENNFAPLQDFDDALFDASVKRLLTQSGVEEVYSETYGIDWITIRSQSNGWIKTHLPDLIKECLMQDDRVKNVEVRILDIAKDYIELRVTVNNSTGEFRV